VTAFERSLSNMTLRLQKLAAASEQKVRLITCTSLAAFLMPNVLGIVHR